MILPSVKNLKQFKRQKKLQIKPLVQNKATVKPLCTRVMCPGVILKL